MSLLYDYLSSIGEVIETSGEQYRTDCVFCGDTRKRLYFSTKTDQCHCFNCEYSGNYITLVAEYEGITRSQAAKAVVVKDRVQSIETKAKEVIKQDPYIAYIKRINAMYNSFKKISINSAAMDYLAGRQVSYEDAYYYGFREGIKYEEEKFQNRIIIPFFEDESLVYFQGRDITGTQYLKALNPVRPEDVTQGKSHFVFNLDKIAPYSTIIVTEGPFDAMRVGRNAVAINGKSISTTQISKILAKKPKEVIVMLDADALKEVFEAGKAFSAFVKTSLVFLEQGDPGDLDVEQVKEALSQKKLFDTLLQFEYQNIFKHS
jgi:DNA primase